MIRIAKLISRLICISITLGFIPVSALATEITLPAAEVMAGKPVSIPVMVDKTDNLAGVKLSMTYDKNLLTFKKADKGKAASGLMHIVNDKNPGVLIIVMAGARGIKGDNFPILTLDFEAKAGITEKKTCRIEVKESQLMSDSLKDTEHKVTVNALTILPAVSGAAKDAVKKAAPVSDNPENKPLTNSPALNPASETEKNGKADISAPESETSGKEKAVSGSAGKSGSDPQKSPEEK